MASYNFFSVYLFATSSLSVFLFAPLDCGRMTSCRHLCTEAEFLDDPLSIIGGYGQTKWAMERIDMQALDVLPGGAIFRPALITGRSTDDAGPNNDLFSSILVGMNIINNLGYYPDLDFRLDMVPVDFFCKGDCGNSYTNMQFQEQQNGENIPSLQPRCDPIS